MFRCRLTARLISFVALCAFAALVAVPKSHADAPSPSAAERLNAPGPEAEELARRAGTWDVVATFWPKAGAEPQVTRQLVAQREMIGTFLHETMHPARGSTTPDFQRIDYLGWNRVEGRWQYVSLDTRLPVGIMPAWSFSRGDLTRIGLQFEPIAFPGLGPQVEGRMLRSDLTIVHKSPNHELKEQHFVAADGVGEPWLAARYEYTRKP
jgi:hypothetical protein